MANTIRDYSATAASNTAVDGADISEGCSPAGINDAIRGVMADLKDVSTGAVALESPAADSLTVTGNVGAATFSGDGSALTGIPTPTLTSLGIANHDDITVDGSGNVGIGTSSPTNKLHAFSLSSTATVAKFAANNYANAGTTYVEIGTQYGDGGSRIGNINPSGNLGTLVFETMTGTSGVFAERARIDSSGNLIKVGGVIKGERGTASAPAYSFSDDTDTGMFNIANADLGFSVGGTERMRIDSSGRVTMPYQPSFRAGGAPSVSAGNVYVNYPTIEHNIGTNLNATNGRFSAPITGRDRVTVTVGNNSSFGVDLRINGGSTIIRIEVINPPGFTWQTGAIIKQLTANDYVDAYTFTGTASIGVGSGGFHGQLIG